MAVILNYLKTSYSKQQKFAHWTKAQSLVLFIKIVLKKVKIYKQKCKNVADNLESRKRQTNFFYNDHWKFSKSKDLNLETKMQDFYLSYH